MRTNISFSTTSRKQLLDTKKFGTAERLIMKNFLLRFIDALLSEPSFTRRTKKLSRSDGLTLYGKLGVNFFSTSDLLNPNIKVTFRLIGDRLIFYIISDNPKLSLDCLLYTRRIAFKDACQRKRMNMAAITFLEINYLEALDGSINCKMFSTRP